MAVSDILLTFAGAMSKKKSTTVERMLFESNLRQSIENSGRFDKPLSDMERKDFEDQIALLKETIRQNQEFINRLMDQLSSSATGSLLVIMTDTPADIERLLLTYERLGQMFPSRIDVEVLDNNGLVQYAKAYANSREYSIDEMGSLAVHTRINDMQTNEHAVTIKEVREMVDQAIDRAEKKNVRHFVDVLIGKRFDDEDMIILREKDFSIE